MIPYVGRALAAYYRNPTSYLESIESPAAAGGTGRDRRWRNSFTQFIGQPPRCKTDQLARRSSRRIIFWEEWRAWRPCANHRVGYESEAAFSRTFKSGWSAPPPSQWRKRRLEARQ